MCKTIAFVSAKSSAGKTTSVVNLASYIAQSGYKVLAIDLDPQCTLSKWFNILNPRPSMYDLIDGYIDNIPSDEIHELTIKSIYPGDSEEGHLFDLLPTNVRMGALENRIPMATRREYILSEIIKRLKPIYNYIFIDCLSLLGNLVINAMTAADSLVIPIEPDMTNYDGLSNVSAFIGMVQKSLNPQLYIEGVIITRYRSQPTYNRDMLREIKDYFDGSFIFNPHIPFSVRVAECYPKGKSIFEHEPAHPAADAYAQIAREVMDNAGENQRCG